MTGDGFWNVRRLRPGDGPHHNDQILEDVEELEEPEPADGLSVRVLAPTVDAITDVTALVGADLEPLRCHIYIRDGVIAAIVPAVAGVSPLAAAPAPEPDQIKASEAVTIDGTDMIAIPGMVDAHARMRPLALAPGLPAAAAATTAADAATAAALMGPTEYELAALQASLQRLKHGVTTVVDHAYPFHGPDMDMACVNSYESSGVRWVCARGIVTRPDSPLCETFEQAADSIRALLADTPATPERLFVAPVSIVHAAPDDFARAAAMAEELDAGIYACVAESPAERTIWHRETQAKPIVALDRAGFLTDRTVLARGVFLDDDEIGLLAARAASIVRCPSAGPPATGSPAPATDGPDYSNANQASLADLLAAGVKVALGTDMVPDLFSAMRAELHNQSFSSGGPAVPSSLEMLQMATGRGAVVTFLGRGVSKAAAPFDLPTQASGIPVGELSPGHVADIVLIPARSLLEDPLLEASPKDLVHAVVHHARGPMVRDVLVEGQLVVSEGLSTVVDEHELAFEVERVRSFWRDRLDLPAGTGGVWFPSPPREDR